MLFRYLPTSRRAFVPPKSPTAGTRRFFDLRSFRNRKFSSFARKLRVSVAVVRDHQIGVRNRAESAVTAAKTRSANDLRCGYEIARVVIDRRARMVVVPERPLDAFQIAGRKRKTVFRFQVS